MKVLLALVSVSVIIISGCNDNPSAPILPEQNSKYGSPNWVELPSDIFGGLGIESQLTESVVIEGKKGGKVELDIDIERPGHQFGDFKVKAKVKVKKHSFPDEEDRIFTITLDPQNAVFNITPSPHTLYEHVEVECEIEGIDVSGINPETFDFVYVGDNNHILETDKDELDVDYNKHKLKVKKAKIFPVETHNTDPGSRFGWVR